MSIIHLMAMVTVESMNLPDEMLSVLLVYCVCVLVLVAPRAVGGMQYHVSVRAFTVEYSNPSTITFQSIDGSKF